jgi:hypothetical protein
LDLPLAFSCDQVGDVTSIPGINTVDLALSSTPVADIIALAATSTNDGTVAIPQGGAAAFAVATTNLGAGASIAVSADTGSAVLPVLLTLCQTNPSNGQCLSPPADSLGLTIVSGAAPTFSVFAQAKGPIPFAPGASRVFVRFTDGNGNLHGATSVAVKTL